MTEFIRRQLIPASHERRVQRRLEARGQHGLANALLHFKGGRAGGRFLIRRLYAVGAEGAVFDVRDTHTNDGPPLVAKLALHPLHRPFDLDPEEIRRRRYALRVEGQYLMGNSSPFMPQGLGVFEVENPVLDDARGDAFAEPEPVLVMEKLPGQDFDRWLARAHRSNVDKATLRRTLDRAAVVLLQALTDLRKRGTYFADLRPGNMRIMGRPDRRVRMLDAGSLVSVHDKSGRFPHVPSYLPPALFEATQAGRTIVPDDHVQAEMAGRTLFEVATGRVPRPGEPVDLSLLDDSNMSRTVAGVVAWMASGECSDVRAALKHLYEHASRRVKGGNDPRSIDTPSQRVIAQARAEDAVFTGQAPPAEPDREDSSDILPLPPKRRGLLSRLLGRFTGR
jgi:hypothetical protein